MVRLLVMTAVVLSFGLTGCQKAKMAKVEKKENTNPYAYPPGGGYPPGNGYPPPRQYPPIPQGPGPQQQQPPPVTQQPGGQMLPPPPLPHPIDMPTDGIPGPDDGIDEDPGDYYLLSRAIEECQFGCEPVKHAPPTDCHEDSSCEPEPVKPEKGECAIINIPPKQKAQKLDVILMVDTSVSMRRLNDGKSELTRVAEQMDQFVHQLDPSTDYNIGVMLAHGPSTDKSPNNLHGKLFKSGAGDVAAISITNLISQAKAQGKSDAEARSAAEAEVVRLLTNKMNVINSGAVNDKSEAQGEVGLLSLYSAVTRPELTNAIKAEGLFRESAALNVIFVSDEQDACYDYRGREPRFADKHERNTFNGICATAVNGTRLTEDAVLAALRSLKGEGGDVILSAIVYTNVNTLPPIDPKVDNDENEQGWGYIDIVQKAHGIQNKTGAVAGLADWGMNDYRAALVQLGKFAQYNIDYDDFTCDTNVKSENIIEGSLDMWIFTEKARIGHFQTACGLKDSGYPCVEGAKVLKASLDKNNGKVVMSVNPEMLQRVMDKAGTEGAKAYITFDHTQQGAIARVERERQLRANSVSQAATEANELDGNDDDYTVVAKSQTQATSTSGYHSGTNEVFPSDSIPAQKKTTPVKTEEQKKKDAEKKRLDEIKKKRELQDHGGKRGERG